MLDFLILSILLVPTVLSEGGQWLALSYGHRTLNWLLPILFHGIAFAEIAREHWNYTGSELAALVLRQPRACSLPMLGYQ